MEGELVGLENQENYYAERIEDDGSRFHNNGLGTVDLDAEDLQLKKEHDSILEYATEVVHVLVAAGIHFLMALL